MTPCSRMLATRSWNSVDRMSTCRGWWASGRTYFKGSVPVLRSRRSFERTPSRSMTDSAAVGSSDGRSSVLVTPATAMSSTVGFLLRLGAGGALGLGIGDGGVLGQFLASGSVLDEGLGQGLEGGSLVGARLVVRDGLAG